MSIEAIKTQDTSRSSLGTIAKGTIAGGVVGCAAKYMLPLTESEMDNEYKQAIAFIREQSNKAKASSIETIRNIKDKTPAQDTFVKMLDAEQNSTGKRVNNMKKIITDAKLDKNGMLELKGIMASVNKKAADMRLNGVKAFDSIIKNKRVLPAYVAAGSVIGFFIGLGQSVFKSSWDA